jgi:hypothetical protein
MTASNVTGRVTFADRFQGFPHGALGGYAAGITAQSITGPAEANLRRFPCSSVSCGTAPGHDVPGRSVLAAV